MCGDTQCPSCGSAQGTLNPRVWVNNADVESILEYADIYFEISIVATANGPSNTRLEFECDYDTANEILRDFGYTADERT